LVVWELLGESSPKTTNSEQHTGLVARNIIIVMGHAATRCYHAQSTQPARANKKTLSVPFSLEMYVWYPDIVWLGVIV